MRYHHIISVIICISFLVACNENDPVIDVPAEFQQLSETFVYKSMEGVDENLLSLDLYYTEDVDKLKPVIIWVHGGGWSVGDKTGKIEDKIALFLSEGWLLVSVNYRLSPYPVEINDPNRIKYPIHNQDIADAIKSIYENVGKYGGDNTKLALLGHSAGAHLVSLTGTREQFLLDVGLDLGVIKGVATIDTEAYNLPEKMAEFNETFINAFGTDTPTLIEASPIHNISDGTDYPPFFVAKRGLTERIESADKFIGRLSEVGVSVEEVDGSIYDHAGINEAIGQDGESLITIPLIDFFRKCFE